jgi:hypothetical protein
MYPENNTSHFKYMVINLLQNFVHSSIYRFLFTYGF